MKDEENEDDNCDGIYKDKTISTYRDKFYEHLKNEELG